MEGYRWKNIWKDTGGRIEGYRVRIKGYRWKDIWKDTWGRMEGYMGKDGRIQGEGWKDTRGRIQEFNQSF